MKKNYFLPNAPLKENEENGFWRDYLVWLCEKFHQMEKKKLTFGQIIKSVLKDATKLQRKYSFKDIFLDGEMMDHIKGLRVFFDWNNM